MSRNKRRASAKVNGLQLAPVTTLSQPSRILVGSPVRQDPRILEHFLGSLRRLERDCTTLDFAFVDDNDDVRSSQLLREFTPGGQVTIASGGAKSSAYTRTEHTHQWREDLIWRVAAFKDWMIALARDGGYDGLLLLDSDLVLHPLMLRQLRHANLDIVSEVFWTRWEPDQPELPQVWVSDHYTLFRRHRMEQITTEQAQQRLLEFVGELRTPGLYEVGGLGACTLISRRALHAGVSFREIPNVSFWGEDRHFCIRAAALGLKLYAETSYPPLHLYRLSELDRVPHFITSCEQRTQQIAALETFRSGVEAHFTRHPAVSSGEEGLRGFAPGLAASLKETSRSQLASAGEDDISRLRIVRADMAYTGEGDATVTAHAVQSGRDDGQAYTDALSISARMLASSDGWQIASMTMAPVEHGSLAIPFVRKTRRNRITLSMLVRNEADKYLADVLRHAATYVDDAVIVDDASTDNSVEVCHSALADIPHTVVRLKESQFHQEWLLRRKQWDLTVARNPDWILMLDADEMFEDAMRERVRELVDQDRYDAVAFRLYDMWDEGHYREDEWWYGHRAATWLRLVRYLPNMSDEWRQTAQHCGQFPIAVHSLQTARSDLRLRHYGWATQALRQQKYERYMRLDPEARFGIAAQYQSILDSNPRVLPWAESDRPAGLAA